MDRHLLQDQVKVLSQVSQVLRQTLDLDRALGAVLEVLARTLSLRKAFVALRAWESGPPRMVASRGLTALEKARFAGAAVDLIQGPAQPSVILKAGGRRRFLRPRRVLPAKGEIAFMGMPIVLGGSLLGFLGTDQLWGEEVPVAEDLRFLQVIAGFLAQLVSLHRQVQRRDWGWRQQIISLRQELSEKTRNLLLAGKSPALAEVRQLLESLGERLSLMAVGGEPNVTDLTAPASPAPRKARSRTPASLSRWKEMEKREILAALARNRWIQSQAAMDLGLTLRQVGYRVKQFGLEKMVKEQRGQTSRSRAYSVATPN
jgi:transcriptional regulator with GAF, ATPase, and Fis domain